MSWDDTDKNTFIYSTQINAGQINLNTKVGNIIKALALNNNLTTYLEVGTWNGMGTTRCFVEGFRSRLTPFVFYSLECNSDKCNFAANLYKDIDNVNILNETLVNVDDIKDTKEIFPDLVEKWHSVDLENIKNCKNFLDRPNLPQIFDVILLDGGEYTTYFEFLKIANRCKMLLLDDTNVDKCKAIVKILKNDNNWKLVLEDNDRNGFCIFERKINHLM